MNKIVTPLALVLAAGPAAAQSVDVGRANWSKFPKLQLNRSYAMEGLVTRVEAMLAKGRCSLPGQTARAFDIEVPYAVLLEPNGTPSRILVGEIGCRPIEMLTGHAALALVKDGLAPTGEPQARWYASKFYYVLQP